MSLDYTVTSSLIRKYGWLDEEMDSRGGKFTEKEGEKKGQEIHEAGEGSSAPSLTYKFLENTSCCHQHRVTYVVKKEHCGS